jgi:NADH-quinone oxidoreductase subunit L
VLLAVGSAVAGFVPLPRLLQPVFRLPAAAEHHGLLVPVMATLAALFGLAAAYYLYAMYTDVPARVAASARGVRRVLEEKYGFDLLFDWFAGQAVVEGSRRVLWRGLDAGVIDGAVNGTARAVAGASQRIRYVQTGLVRAYALLILGGAVVLLAYLLWVR